MLTVGAVLFGSGHGRGHPCQHGIAVRLRRIRAQAIKSAGAYQRFHHAAIDLTQIQAIAKIKQIFKRAVCFTRLHDHFYGRQARALHGAQAIQNLLFVYGGEFKITAIDIGRQHLNLIGPAIVIEGVHAVGVVHVGRQGRGQKGRRVMRF